jgi:hypothetical protein
VPSTPMKDESVCTAGSRRMIREGLLPLGHSGERDGLRSVGDPEDQPRVLGREEPLGDDDIEQHGQHEGDDRYHDRGGLVLEDDAQAAGIAPAQPLEEPPGAPGEATRCLLAPSLQQLGAQHGCQRQRDQRGDQDGDAQRDGELPEETSHDVAHEEERNEHGDQRHRQREDGEADLSRAFQRRLQRRITRLNVAGDVLDHHDRVVHHEARGDGQRHQREVVEAKTQHIHHGEGPDDGDWHSDAGDEGGGRASQEEKDDERHQDHGQHQLELHIAHRGADGRRPVGDDRDLDGRGQGALELGQQPLDPIHDLDEVGAGLALDVHDDRRLVAHPRRLPDVLGIVHGVGNVREQDGRAAPERDHQPTVVVAPVELIIGADGVGLLGPVEAALGLVDVGRGDGRAHIVEREAIGREPRRVGLDPDRGLLAAAERDEPDARQLGDLWDEARVGQVFHGRQRQRGRGQPQREDRRVGRVDLAVDGRIRQILGQEGRRGVDRRLHLLLGDVQRQAQIELQRDHGAAAGAGGGHLLEAGHLAELTLEGGRDRRGHHVGAGPGVKRLHLNRGIVHLGQSRNGEQPIAHCPCQDDGGGEQGGSNRPQDERAREVHEPGRAAERSRLVGSTRERS